MAPRGAGCRPDRGKPVGQRRVHDAGVRPPRDRHRVERGGRLRAGKRGEGSGGRATLLGLAEREAGRPSSACPLFIFLNSFSALIFPTHFDKFKSFFSFGTQNKRCSK